MNSDDLDFGQTIRGLVEGQLVFERFTLRHILGRGGMGVVWLAWDGKLEREVALKFLPETMRLDSTAVDELKRETRKCLRLTHPHIVRIYDFFEDSQLAALSMEYVEGQTLSALRLKQPGQVFMPETLRPILSQLGQALGYAHNHERVVHRDIKPGNLMLDARGNLKVADFGISSSISDSVSRLSVARGSSGSPPYMSPQQMLGEIPKANDDLYSVGASIYELLTGKPPFYQGNIFAQAREVVPPLMAARRNELQAEGDSNLPPIPENWESAVAACLAKRPEDRVASATELMQRLDLAPPAHAQSSQSAPSERAAPGETTPSQKSGGFSWRWPVLGTVLVLAIVGIVFATMGGESNSGKEPTPPPASPTPAPSSTPTPEPAPTPPPPASLGVSTQPLGASVQLDGEDLGSTPLSVEVSSGSHTLSVSRFGFDPVEQTLEIDDGQKLELPKITLVRSVGDLRIESEPKAQPYEIALIESPVTGETLQDSGAAVEGLAPVTLRGLPTGVYRVIVTRGGHKPQEKAVTVSHSRLATIKVEFGPDTLLEETREKQQAPSSRIKGALREEDMPAFFRRKLMGKNASFSAALKYKGETYCLIDYPYRAVLYKITPDNAETILSSDGPFWTIQMVEDRKLAFNLAVLTMESWEASLGREKLQTAILARGEFTEIELEALRELDIKIPQKYVLLRPEEP